MRKFLKLLFTFLFSIFFCISYAQPHIKGDVKIDMKSGLISCDFTMSQLPTLEKYSILLNKGMNIKYFKNLEQNLIHYDYGEQTKGDAIEYTFENSGDTILQDFKISYKGAFPVYVDEFNSFDYKGAIAFNDKTLRATEQSTWYPVIYDISNDKLINSYSYDLNVSISNGNTIFINGSAPLKGNSSHFESTKAYPLLLFAGTYDFIGNQGNYVLNTSITKETAEGIFRNIELIKNSLANNLDIEFTDKIYLINHETIKKQRKEDNWGFNTFPSFAFAGLNFNKLVNEDGKFSINNYKFMGHEFGHNYFGNNVMSGKYRWFWLESFAEYLSYNVLEDLCSKELLQKVLLNQIEAIKDDSFIALDQIEKANDITEKYRYRLAPLMLKCFEDEFGRDKTNHTIKSLLEYAKTETLSLEHWKKAAISSGIRKNEFERFEKEFVSNSKFKENIIAKIKENYNEEK